MPEDCTIDFLSKRERILLPSLTISLVEMLHWLDPGLLLLSLTGAKYVTLTSTNDVIISSLNAAPWQKPCCSDF